MGDYGSTGSENLVDGNGWNTIYGPGQILPVESSPSGVLDTIDNLSQQSFGTGVHYSTDQGDDYRIGLKPIRVPQPQNLLMSVITQPPLANTQLPISISPVQNSIPSSGQQIKVPTSVINNFNLRRIGILALIKLGLIKLKAIGFLKILLLLLLKLKLFLIAAFLKYQLLLKLITFFKTLMLPLFVLPVLPILISLIYPMVVSPSDTNPISNMVVEPISSPISSILSNIFNYGNERFQESTSSSEVTYTLIPGETTLVPGSTSPALSPGLNNMNQLIPQAVQDANNILVDLPRSRQIKITNKH